jgi:GTP-binding protein HflX
MDQQTGATKSARGPGETASELMARTLDRRLGELTKALRRAGTSGETQRRERGACKRIALVGYTNAGKTSLMNALTSAGLSARDVPFETLDTTSRCLTRHGGDVLLSDTVGFIRRLPERLLASFESTLAEIAEASLLAIVVDAADDEWGLHLETTLGVLARLGARDLPRFYVFNKADRLPAVDAGRLARASEGHPWAALSSRDGPAVEALRERLLGAVNRGDATASIFVPYEATRAASVVYARCRVVASEAAPGGLRLRVQGPPELIARVQKLVTEARQ